ncbi:PQQ-binding-like beta-propeller repeat protein [Nocardia sp. NPDC019395]|uniref:outer membrane protein assembly factor BamB family protein n=1 Tax=Nocardia sp. NPDC019395 TaxID=3154686 RepID=UPI0033CA6778
MRIGGGVRTVSWLAVVLAAVGVLTACGTDVDDITVGRGLGWPAAGHEARNSGNTQVTGSRDLSLRWSRPVGGPTSQPLTVGSEGQIFLTARTDVDCEIFSYQMRTGRKRFCNPLGPHSIYSPTLLDGASNVYVGLDSAVESANQLGQPRWRTPVAGVPTGMQFTGDGHVLVITQSGQLDVLERQTGKRMVPTQQLLPRPDFLQSPNQDWPPAGAGLEDCRTGGPDCAVATIAAMDLDSGRIYATVRKPGESDASLVALRYADGKVEQEWSSKILVDGSATDPALSADGATIYIGDNSKRLLAVNTVDGKPKWEAHLDWEPRRGISVSDDGLILPAGDDGYLMALRDTGISYERVWERKDLALRGAPVQSAGGTGYVTAAIGEGLNLITFDTATGATLDSDVLPGAEGTTTGTAVGSEGEVVVATRLGEIFAFREKA